MKLVELTDKFVENHVNAVLDDPRVGTIGSRTDENGIKHIYVYDLDKAWELINGEWVEKIPF
jgi:hypothetical protein